MKKRQPEIDLLRASVSGDRSAFEKIVIQYQSLVCAITFSAVGRTDLSEELAQETFLRAWQNLSQLRDLAKFRQWLCSIVRSQIQNYLRKKKREPISLSEEFDPTQIPSETAEMPEHALLNREEAMLIQKALMRIPLNYREPLVLFYRQEQSVRQVAQSLEITENTVRSRLFRGRQMLREEMTEIVEEGLERTTPGPAFTKAVMVAIGGLAVGAAATVEAATASAGSSGAATGGLSGVLAGVTGKVLVGTAAVVVGVSSILVVNHLKDSEVDTKSIEQVQEQTVAIAEIPDEPVSTQFQPEVTALPSEAGLPVQESTAVAVETKGLAKSIETNKESSLTKNKPVENPKIAADAPEEEPYEFKPKGFLSGLITDVETGKPIKNARVAITLRSMDSAKTDEHGFYFFKKLRKPGNYRIGLSHADYVGFQTYSDEPVIHLEKGQQTVRHFQLPRACKFKLVVLNEQGELIEGAQTEVGRLGGERYLRYCRGYQNQTDKNGEVLLTGLPPSDSEYIATITHSTEGKWETDGQGRRVKRSWWDYAPGYCTAVLQDPNVIPTMTVVLQEGVSVRGYAQYSDQVPAGDLSIYAHPDWWHSTISPQGAEIEPNGFFTLKHIVPGNYHLQAHIPTGEDSAMGVGLFSTSLPLENDEFLKVTIPQKSPKSLATIKGVVRFKDGEKPDYLNISGYSQIATRHTSTHLNLRGEGPDYPFELDRLEPGTYTLQFEGSEIETKKLTAIKVPCEDLVVELSVGSKPNLYGMVVDDLTKQPIDDFRVRIRKIKTLRGPNYVPREEWTMFQTKKGNFQLEVPGPGVYQVQASAEGYAPLWSDEINTDDNQAVMISMFAGGSIQGKVVNQKGTPVAGATVVALSHACGGMPRVKDIFVSKDGSIKTDAAGKFTLSSLPEGSETIKVTHPQYTFSTLDRIPVKDGTVTEDIEVVLKQGGVIEGFVYDQKGQPQGGVVIVVQDDSGYGGTSDELAGRLGMASSEPNGFYQIFGLPEKMCYLRRKDDWNKMGVVRRTVMPANGTVSRVDFGGPVTFSGKIVIDGTPIAQRKLVFSSPASPHFGSFKAYTLTDSDGRFTIYGIIPGMYSLYYEQPNKHNDWIKLMTVNCSGESMDLGVIPKQKSVLYVYLQQPENYHWDISSMYVAADKKRYSREFASVIPPAEQSDPYKIEPVTPGIYQIKMHRADRLIYSQTVTVEEDQEEMAVAIPLPEANCSLTGVISTDIPSVVIWSQDRKVMGYAEKGDDGSYQIDHLPYGKYFASLNWQMEEWNAVPFDLMPGQTLMLNFDKSMFEQSKPAYLIVNVVGENGVPLQGAKVRLISGQRTIESMEQHDFNSFFMVSPGQYKVTTEYAGYQKVEQPILLEASNSLDDGAVFDHRQITIRMTPDKSQDL